MPLICSQGGKTTPSQTSATEIAKASTTSNVAPAGAISTSQDIQSSSGVTFQTSAIGLPIPAPPVTIAPSAITPAIPSVEPLGLLKGSSSLIKEGASLGVIKYIADQNNDIGEAKKLRKERKKENICFFWHYEKKGEATYIRYRDQKECDEFELNLNN